MTIINCSFIQTVITTNHSFFYFSQSLTPLHFYQISIHSISFIDIIWNKTCKSYVNDALLKFNSQNGILALNEITISNLILASGTLLQIISMSK